VRGKLQTVIIKTQAIPLKIKLKSIRKKINKERMAEWLIVSVLKALVLKYRGFESLFSLLLGSKQEAGVYFCYNYNYYKNYIRYHLISKHNILNFFEVDRISRVRIIFSLKHNKRECNLLLFWLIFTLSGRKPIILKRALGFKKNKFKFILMLNTKAFVSIMRVFAVFILAEHEKKKKMILKKEQSSYFFMFNGSYLEYLDTFYFYNCVSNQDIKFLFENLHLVFKFKANKSEVLNTALNSLQLPTSYDSKRDAFTNQGQLGG
jgi:hypothetical protein